MVNEEDALIKFLIARKYDVPKAEEMLRGYLKWRKEYGCESLFATAQFHADFATKWPAYFGGKDREVICIYNYGIRLRFVCFVIKVHLMKGHSPKRPKESFWSSKRQRKRWTRNVPRCASRSNNTVAPLPMLTSPLVRLGPSVVHRDPRKRIVRLDKGARLGRYLPVACVPHRAAKTNHEALEHGSNFFDYRL